MMADIAVGHDSAKLFTAAADESFVDQAIELKSELGFLKTLVFMGEGETPDGMLSYEQVIADNAPIEDAGRGGEELWVIFYTAGTTSHPKGVMMSHRAVRCDARHLAMLPDIEDLKFLCVAGFFHFAGASALLYITMTGGTHVLLPKFEPLPVVRAISEHRVTDMVLVPTMINMLIHHPDFETYDLSSLRTCIYGGSPMPEALIQFAMKRMPTWRFYRSQSSAAAISSPGLTIRWATPAPTAASPARPLPSSRIGMAASALIVQRLRKP